MASKKPKIDNVWWRGEWAWGRKEKNGKTFREPLETKDPKVARERVKKWLAGLEEERWGQKPRRSYAEAVNKFIDEHLPRLKPRGAQRYLQSLKVLTEHFDGKMLDEISSSTLSEFEQRRRREGKGGKGVTSGTILNDLTCLSAIFTCAMEWEWVEGNRVAAYIRNRSKRGLLMPAATRTRYLGHQEEDDLLERCMGKLSRWDADGVHRGEHIMLRAGIILTLDIGLRKEELLASDWNMIDLDRRQWEVPVELAKTGRKTGHGRQVPILPRSLAILKALPRALDVLAGPNDPLGRTRAPFVLWHQEGEERRRYFDLLPMLKDTATGGRTYIFRREVTKLAQKGLKLTDARRAEIAKIMEEQAWADVIPNLRWHDLRRTCGCRLLQDMRFAMEVVSKWLGHASIEQTEKAYAFLEVKDLHAAVARTLEEATRHIALTGPAPLDKWSRTKAVTVEQID